MVTAFDVNPNKLIERLAQKLKNFKELTPPEWIKFVKTGPHKERPPEQQDWWYYRLASMLRKLYVLARPIGVSRLRKFYGGAKKRGSAPRRFCKGSGSIIRKGLQALEKAGLVKFVEVPRKGRVLTDKGKSLLDRTAYEVWKEEHGNK